MRLSLNSWHNSFYQLVYHESWNKEVPPDLCTYFWALVLGIFSLPIIWIGLLIKGIWKTQQNYIANLLATLLIYIVMAVLGLLTLSLIKHTKETLIMFGLLTTIGLVLWLIKWFFGDFLPDTAIIRNIGEGLSIGVQGVKSVKNNYCPIIEWKSEEKEGY